MFPRLPGLMWVVVGLCLVADKGGCLVSVRVRDGALGWLEGVAW
ncbi:hypothetical protein FEAC_21010 [Ferrimicrobium acidiphilum DSM 19497]|uniref:Uncharacterized protein n=1 Tax=Ferrimicrobium acidiphilum DSM 19497 TaxID=1121877 RepID=A0A0D8FT38_9ACTN|nr:hypothetical protein FEAC_21010 [Ferrimicrobium acidiphilum DSM 19497]